MFLRLIIPYSWLVFVFFMILPSSVSSNENAGNAMGHDSASSVVVARVNGTQINMAQLIQKMMDITESKYGRREISPLLADKIRAEATDKLITEELAYQKAKAKVSVTDKMVARYLDDLKKQYGGQKGFEGFLQRKRITLDQLRTEAPRVLTVKLFIDQEINAVASVTEQEVRSIFAIKGDKYYAQKEGVQVNKILFFLDPEAKESLEKVESVIARFKDEAGNDPTKLPPDGTFVVQKKISLDKIRDAKLYTLAKELPEYGFSEPAVVDGTLHVVQLTGYQPEIVQDFKKVLPSLKKKIEDRRRQNLLKKWIAGLRQGADVEIMDIRL